MTLTHVCSMSIKGDGNWVATSDNYLRSGSLSLKLHPSHESLAGLAVACCALLTSADEGLPDRSARLALALL